MGRRKQESVAEVSKGEKVADRPHRITIMLALLAASVSAAGVLVNTWRNRPIEIPTASPTASERKTDTQTRTAYAYKFMVEGGKNAEVTFSLTDGKLNVSVKGDNREKVSVEVIRPSDEPEEGDTRLSRTSIGRLKRSIGDTDLEKIQCALLLDENRHESFCFEAVDGKLRYHSSLATLF